MIKLNVNGEERRFDGDPEMPLLWALRDVAGLTGTKYGCGKALATTAEPGTFTRRPG